ncbi:amidohydrolase family protein [Cryptosporangium sp. NPDC048952]|uniref:amidohydrolase family protein n=1 Tax=Cryptosporangium sp. NPDC048952 TaxID=3363961 RepID=UPI00371E3801
MLIDASVHIFFRDNRDFRTHLREPYASRGIPDYEMDWYGAPGGEYVPHADGDHYPGSDPDVVGQHVFEYADLAILHPMSRGTLPDRHLTSAVLAAHNDMLVTRWLAADQRYRGTIRVNPEDIPGALREVERYRDHPQVVQVAVPMQSREPYGKPQFWPLWEAAAAAGLPVAAHIEAGQGVGYPPTPSGHPDTYEGYLGFMALNYLYHQMNMIAEGVFERFDALKFVWADGAADFLTPFSWRMDVFGRPHLEQTPWAPKIPSDYLPGRVFFVQGSLDGPGDTDFAGEWLDFTGKDRMVMFGSSYPHWQHAKPGDLPSALSDAQRDRILWRNAADLYGLPVPEGVAS